MFRFLLLVAMLCSSSPKSRAASNLMTLQSPSPSRGAGIYVNMIVPTAPSSTTIRHPLQLVEVALHHHHHNDTCRDGTAHHQEATSSTILIETPFVFVLLASIFWSLRRCTRTQGQHCNVSSLIRPEYSLPNISLMSLLAVALFAAFAEDLWNYIMMSASFATWRTLGEAYMGYLESHPITTKSLSAGVIAMIGDYCAQWIDFSLQGDDRLALALKHPNNDNNNDNNSYYIRAYGSGRKRIPTSTNTVHVGPSIVSIYGRYSLRRGFALLADGMLITGPLMHLGFEIFERWMPIAGVQDDPAAANLAAVLHVIADTLILDSFFVAFCFVSTGLLEGMHCGELWLQFKSDCWSSLIASWATSVVLCPIQFCFFRYLPLQLRVLSVNSIDLVWGAVQSFMSHRNRYH